VRFLHIISNERLSDRNLNLKMSNIIQHAVSIESSLGYGCEHEGERKSKFGKSIGYLGESYRAVRRSSISSMDFLGESCRMASADVMKSKINAEIGTLDLRINSTKKNFGIEVYDFITTASKVQSRRNVWSTMCNEKFVKLASAIRAPYEDARKEISVLVAERESFRDDIDIINTRLKVNGYQVSPNTIEGESNNQQKPCTRRGSILSTIRNVTSARIIKDVALQAKLIIQMKNLNRKINANKEQFGIRMYAVFDCFKQNEVMKMDWANRDNDIIECYYAAKRHVDELISKKEEKRELIQDLYRVEF